MANISIHIDVIHRAQGDYLHAYLRIESYTRWPRGCLNSLICKSNFFLQNFGSKSCLSALAVELF